MKNKLILGTVQFGLEYGINNIFGKPSAEEVFNILTKASESGIATLDTADQYGNSQELIGAFIRKKEKRFDINTKFKVTDQSVRHQLEQSLSTLSVDKIHVYFYHKFSEFVQHPATRLELKKMKDSGKLDKIGVSVYTNAEMEIAACAPEIDVIQIPFNLLDNASQRSYWLSMAKENGKTIQARSVFLQGLFFKKILDFPPYLFSLRKYVEQLQSMATESGLAMENMCLSYVLSKSEIDQVLIGVDSADQLDRNLLYAQSQLSPEFIKEIDAVYVEESELLYPINWK
jgi:aryl-alcohol dehydrogenase-like predicted oxidoreductase